MCKHFSIEIYFSSTSKFQHFICKATIFCWSFYLPWLTQHNIFCNTSVVMCTCCGTHLFDSCTVFSRGVPKHEKTPAVVYKGSSLHFPKVQYFLFYKYHTQVSAVLQEHHLFHKSSAVLSLRALTQNPRISAVKFQFFSSKCK